MEGGTLFLQAAPFLPDERLRELARCAELEAVHHLTFSVDTTENSLGDAGHRLPALRQLRLDGSNIGTLRDLGTGFGELHVLWMGRSHLRELEGIGAFAALTELYLAFNEVEDLSPLMGAERLQVLDLEANAVADPAQVHYLMGCAELHALTLEGNPIAEGGADYRVQVQQALPQLQLLDDAPLLLLPPPEPPSTPPAAPLSRDDAVMGPAARPAEGAGVDPGGSSSAADGDDPVHRRELRLVRDGIKYADALREYDVQSREALSMSQPPAAHEAGHGGGYMRPRSAASTSSRGSSSSASFAGGGGARAARGAAAQGLSAAELRRAHVRRDDALDDAGRQRALGRAVHGEQRDPLSARAARVARRRASPRHRAAAACVRRVLRRGRRALCALGRRAVRAHLWR